MNIDHLSYSTAKKIYRKGIDYALGTKLGLIEESFGEEMELGNIIHSLALEDQTTWVVSPYDSFRTNDAKAWKAQLENADNDYESQSSRSWLTEQFVFTDALLALLGGTTNGK